MSKRFDKLAMIGRSQAAVKADSIAQAAVNFEVTQTRRILKYMYGLSPRATAIEYPADNYSYERYLTFSWLEAETSFPAYMVNASKQKVNLYDTIFQFKRKGSAWKLWEKFVKEFDACDKPVAALCFRLEEAPTPFVISTRSAFNDLPGVSPLISFQVRDGRYLHLESLKVFVGRMKELYG